ncbi:MAG: hypothetical protein HOV68_30090 [Streptomycetaceae bacterium]|nr:hypothetical protein [Streptomycetaceae bacterium]
MNREPLPLVLPFLLPVPVRGPVWLDEVVRRQCGLATLRQLRRGGVTDRTRLRRVRQGAWRRMAPGVVCLAASRPSRRQRAAAAVLHAGRGAVVTGLTALELAGAGYVRYASEIHVLVQRSCRIRPLARVVYERTAALPHPLPLRFPPTAPYARAVVDACRRISDDAQARANALAAVQQRLCDVRALRAECERGSPRNTVRMRAIIDEADSGVRSLPEADLRRLVRAAKLPEPLWNPRLYLPDGRFLCVPDGLWADEAVVVEVDSVAHHGFGADRVRTAERAGRMRAAGLTVVAVRPRHIRDDGPGVARLLGEVLNKARARAPTHLGLTVVPSGPSAGGG